MNFPPSLDASQETLTFLAWAIVVVSALVHLIVAVAVMNDSALVQRRGARLMFFDTLGWTLIALMTGLLGLVAYWLMHHSSFRSDLPESGTKGSKDLTDYVA